MGKLLLSILLASHPVSATELCQDLRLDTPGGSMEDIPIEDQGDWGTCYAVVAATMYDVFHRHSSPSSFKASSIEGALGQARLQHQSMRDALYTEGADSCDVANYYLRQGACDEVVLKQNPPLRRKFEDLLRFYLSSAPMNPSIAQLEKEAESELLSLCSQQGRQSARFAACVKSHRLQSRHFLQTKNQILTHLQSSAAQPVAIDFCEGILSQGRRYSDGNQCDDSHEVLIIGKRLNSQGTCQLLIQNSWGSNCDDYSADWECHDGKIWLDADNLSKSLIRYSYLR